MARLNVWHVGPCTPEKRAFQSYALWDPQPVKADECISDVVTEPQTIDEMSCCVEYTDWSRRIRQAGRSTSGVHNMYNLYACSVYSSVRQHNVPF